MTRSELIHQIKEKRSFLCVGLDSDPQKIPAHLHSADDPVFEFNKAIIDATAPYCVAYKPNIAFYESRGAKGWESLRKTLEYIPDNCFTIADAKRGDIGNTAAQYAATFFNKQAAGLDFNSITVAPYMGEDSVSPFLEHDGKWTILLALTSNSGSKDFQLFSDGQRELFEQVVAVSQKWGTPDNLMYVVGATRGEDIARVRKLAPQHFFLVPGVGAQGGSLNDVVKYGLNEDCGLLVNSSRAIIYASSDLSFAHVAANRAQAIQSTMSQYLKNHGII